jgi:hypothetical protein
MTTFSLPPEVEAAQMTGRSELLMLLRQRIDGGHTLPPEQVEGLIGLLEQSVDDWERVTRLQQYMGEMAKQIKDHAKGLVRRADHLRELSGHLEAIDRIRGDGGGAREEAS